MARSPRKIDPSRTATLRRSFAAEMSKKFNAVRREIRELVVTEDAFGLSDPGHLLFARNQAPQTWAFRSDPAKVEAFRRWLKDQVDQKILISDNQGKPWLAPYIESAYKKGVMRAYRTGRKAGGSIPGMVPLPPGEVLGISFFGPEQTARAEMLYTRAWTELQGVTAAMDQQLSRELTLGLIQGQSPTVIARNMSKRIAGLTKTRAKVIARTEIIAAHAEGQLDGYQTLGVDEVEVIAEWQTAGDNKVCPRCAAMEGVRLKLDDARGLIPRHPSCRCAWAPVRGERGSREKDLRSVRASIRAEKIGRPKESTTWPGRDLL